MFKQNFGIKDEEADDIITLTQQVKESCRSFARDMLLEVNDNKKDDGADDVFIEDALAKLNSLTVKFAKSKVSNGKETINISYTSYCGLTADTIKFFEDKSGINVGTHKGSLDEHKYAMGFIVRMPKKDDERSYNGSPAAKYFTDSEVKKMFKDALKSRKF